MGADILKGQGSALGCLPTLPELDRWHRKGAKRNWAMRIVTNGPRDCSKARGTQDTAQQNAARTRDHSPQLFSTDLFAPSVPWSQCIAPDSSLAGHQPRSAHVPVAAGAGPDGRAGAVVHGWGAAGIHPASTIPRQEKKKTPLEYQGHVTLSGPVRKRVSVWSLSHPCQHSRKKRRFGNAVFLEKTCAYATKNVLSVPRQALFSKHSVFVVLARATRFSVFSVPTLTFMRAVEECFGINACLRTRSILNKIVELAREDAGVFLESTKNV